MATKKISVTKKIQPIVESITEQQILNAKRWNCFIDACGVAWDDLSEEAKDFFYISGDIHTPASTLNDYMDQVLIAGIYGKNY